VIRERGEDINCNSRTAYNLTAYYET